MSAGTAMRQRCESPIEALLVQAIGEEIDRCSLRCRPTTQARIGPYRVDILVEMDGRRLVVECDGAEFHAATKEQVERDKRRDRFFAAQNISVMRFTGAEINRSPRACAAEVGAWLEAQSQAAVYDDNLRKSDFRYRLEMQRLDDQTLREKSARKAAIMRKWERGEITRMEACRLIRRGGLVDA